MSVYQKILPSGVAIGSTAIALLLSIWLNPILPASLGLFFYIAVLVSAWYGGMGSSIATTLLSSLAIHLGWVPLSEQLDLKTIAEFQQLGTFVGVAFTLGWLASHLKDSQATLANLNQPGDRDQQALSLLQQQLEQQRLVMEMTQRIRDSLNLPEILQTTVDRVRQFLQTDRVIIFRFFPNWHGIVAVESCGADWTAILSTEIYDPCFSEEYIEPFKQGLVTAKSDIYKAGISECHLQLLSQFQVRANLVVPILQGNELWGLLIAHHCVGPRLWQESEIALLRQIASQASIALQQAALLEQAQLELMERKQAEVALQKLNAELEHRVAERTLELTALTDRLLLDIRERQQAEATLHQQTQQKQLLWNITQVIRRSLDLEVILNTAVAEVRQLLNVDRATVYRFKADWSGDFIVESVADGWEKIMETDVRQVWEDIYFRETKGGRFLNHETLLVTDIFNHPHSYQIEPLEPLQARAYAVVPIFVGELLWGLFSIYQNSDSHAFQTWEMELLQQIASQLAIAIHQAELYSQLQIELQERQQAVAVLREAERRWRLLLENVQLIVVGLDRAGNINYVNPFFCRLTGYTDGESLGKNLFEDFVSVSEKEKIQAIFSDILIHNAYPYYQNYILTKSGEERFIAWNNTLLQDSQGNKIGVISIGEDITERQKIEQIKNEFIGIVSHELRTPLTAIQMSLGLLKTGIYANKLDKAQRLIEIALIDTNRLVNLVNDILDLERLESGRLVLEKTMSPAAELMQQAVEGIQAIAAQGEITLTIEPTDIMVWAASDPIVQTLTNLLSNAIKFSSPHSHVHLRAKRQGHEILFQTIDRGRGIPADKLEAIFGRFQQVDASDSRKKGGTGLGLPICRSIVERHGGKIWAESTLGQGSTFFFTLPLPPESVE